MIPFEEKDELSDEAKMNDTWAEDNERLFSDKPITLLTGGGSGKILTSPEDYDELAERLTSEDFEIKGTGRVLRGEAAAAYGRAMLEDAVGGPEKLAELIEKLEKETR